jgi:peptidyl-prolyl cis-trans isomerase SurA
MVACAAVPARRAAVALAVSLLLCAAPRAAPAADAGKLIDRIVAVVDDDPILSSEIDQAIGLGLVERGAGEDDTTLRRRVLDDLIAERLRFHEVDSFGFTDVPVAQIEAHYAEIRARFPDPAAFAARLAELGLGEAALRQLVARQLMVLTYVEERLGARVLVEMDDIRAYYETTLKQQMAARKQPLPPIESVRESIRALIKEQRLNDEIARWTDELRRQADVVDNFSTLHAELPPVRYEVPPPAH